jgi:hypothetical protein
MGEIRTKIDLMERFYKIKLSEGKTAEQALEKVKSKFDPSAYDISRLAERTQANCSAKP